VERYSPSVNRLTVSMGCLKRWRFHNTISLYKPDPPQKGRLRTLRRSEILERQVQEALLERILFEYQDLGD
jgi:hypothetical protein